MNNKKVMQSAIAKPHHNSIIYNISLYYVGCKEVIKEVVKSLLGGLVLMSVFTPLIIHMIRGL